MMLFTVCLKDWGAQNVGKLADGKHWDGMETLKIKVHLVTFIILLICSFLKVQMTRTTYKHNINYCNNYNKIFYYRNGHIHLQIKFKAFGCRFIFFFSLIEYLAMAFYSNVC